MMEVNQVSPKFQGSKMKVSKSRAMMMELAIKSLAIVMAIAWLGNVIYVFVEQETLLPLFLFDFDLGLILVFWILFSSFGNSFTIGSVTIGWIVAAIYVKKQVGKDANTIIALSSFLPILILDFVIGIVLLTLVIGSGELVLLPFILLLLLGILLVGAISLVLTIPGLIISNFVSFRNRNEPTQLSQPDYLVLDVIPEEKVSTCPFKMQQHNGCAYLGYRAPDGPLICDFESYWRRCFIYAELYKKIDEELKQ